MRRQFFAEFEHAVSGLFACGVDGYRRLVGMPCFVCSGLNILPKSLVQGCPGAAVRFGDSGFSTTR